MQNADSIIQEDGILKGLKLRNPLGPDYEIHYIPTQALYRELSRRRTQITIPPNDINVKPYLLEIPMKLQRDECLEVGVITYLNFVRPGFSRLRFGNGRHRTAALAKLGLKKVPLACNRLTAAALLLIESEWADGLPPANARWFFNWCLEK